MTGFSRRGLLAAALALPAAIALPPPARADVAGLPASAPLHVGKVGLKARDADRVAEWYVRTLGLRRLAARGRTIFLGAGDAILLEIEGDSRFTLSRATDAGLYHTAFLLPGRNELGRWLRHAIQSRIPVDGVADHLVSEAVYLTDPEGNGVEIYADRPAETWIWREGQVHMGTGALDVEALVALAPAFLPPVYHAPAATMVGHVHLKVGDATRAAEWWQDRLRFDAVRRRPGATFLSTGGYHHHIAVNQWQSGGATARGRDETGLSFIELASRGVRVSGTLLDPWGIEVRTVPLA